MMFVGCPLTKCFFFTHADLTAVAEYYVTRPIPQRFNAGIIVASMAVAALGAYSTLLLLGKRTSNRGNRNIALLVLAALTMSAVGIWGMHFIGMHMSLMPTQGVTWYITFHPAFTVLSLFVPTIALILAFVFVDYQATFSSWRVGLSGIITGLIVALMHFSASFKANFDVSYRPAQTTVSIVIACLAATVALVFFFRFRSQWQDSWWKRLLCAMILASGVGGMHYIACWGTSYRVPKGSVNHYASFAKGNRKNIVTTIAIAVMCFVIVVISTVIAVSDVLILRDARRKAKKVVVASATFDKQGRLLVKPDGTMPMKVIETDVMIRDVLDALDHRQPTFQWLFALSWDWDIIAPFIKAITSRFVRESQRAQDKNGKEGKGVRSNARNLISSRMSLDTVAERETSGPQALADFRDRVIDAASHLAGELDIPLKQIGVLYDYVLPTGTRKNNLQHNPQFSPVKVRGDDESSINGPVPSIFGDDEDGDEGVMLFLVRELPSSTSQADSVEKYTQKGYRMTETRFLAGVLADRVAVGKNEMETLLESLKLYAKRGTRPVVQPGGVYAGLFGVRASMSKQGGLDVLVYNFARHQIPAYRLPEVKAVTEEMRGFLSTLDQQTMEEAMKTCERESIRSGERKRYLQSQSSLYLAESDDGARAAAEQESIESMIQFQTALFIALDALHNSVRFYPKITQTARLSAEILEVPSSLDDSAEPAQMILVQAVLPETRTLPSPYGALDPASDALPSEKPSAATPFVFTPYTLFSKSQMMLLRGRQADEFEHEIMLELRRRYPSSLMQEADEKLSLEDGRRSMLSRKASMASLQGHALSTSSFGKDSEEKDLVRYHDNVSKKARVAEMQPFPSMRRWTAKLAGGGSAAAFPGRRSRDGNGETNSNGTGHLHRSRHSGQETRRISITSVGSRPATSPATEHEMRDISIPVLKSDDPRPVSPTSPGSILSGGSSAGAQQQQPSPPPPASLNIAHPTSLGIRRFTEGNMAALSSTPAAGATANQSLFAQPSDEIIEEELDDGGKVGGSGGAGAGVGVGTVSTLLGAAFELATPTSAPSRVLRSPLESVDMPVHPGTHHRREREREHSHGHSRDSHSHPHPHAHTHAHAHTHHLRPSTAPSSGRRESALQRPRTADARMPTSPVLSQRHAANVAANNSANGRSNQASLMARLRSDDWATRHLRTIERSPAGEMLLGVEF